jgi:inosine triphosphate pyrophosphatase
MEGKTTFYFCTENNNKYEEFKTIFQNIGLLEKYNFEQIKISIPEYQGREMTIAKYKVLYVQNLRDDNIKYPLMIEDTSFGLSCLNGFPGPYIKDFMKKNTLKEIYEITYKLGCTKAYAACTVAIIKDASSEPIIVQGSTNGTIVNPTGKTGFGWDPIFALESIDDLGNKKQKSFAEMSKDEKNSRSHRYQVAKEIIKHF